MFQFPFVHFSFDHLGDAELTLDSISRVRRLAKAVQSKGKAVLTKWLLARKDLIPPDNAASRAGTQPTFQPTFLSVAFGSIEA